MLTFWTVVAACVVALLWRYQGRIGGSDPRPDHRPRVIVYEVIDGVDYPDDAGKGIVFDRDAYVRPRENTVKDFRSHSIDDDRRIDYQVRHVQRGIIRHEPLDLESRSPRILLIGDSQMYGYAHMQDHLYYLLESGLQKSGWPEAIVVNASCPYYGLYQYVLRARSIADEVKPDLLLAVVFTGNDVLELEDVNRPHLDDELREQPLSTDAPVETTSLRFGLVKRTVPRRYEQLFWQGLNQAIYFHQRPARLEPALAKAVRSLELLDRFCDDRNAQLIVALLPSYEDVVDYELPFELDSSIDGILTDQVNRRIRVELKAAAEARGIPVIDLFDTLHGRADPYLYARDFHLWDHGHKLAAEALLPVVTDLLRHQPSNPP